VCVRMRNFRFEARDLLVIVTYPILGTRIHLSPHMVSVHHNQKVMKKSRGCLSHLNRKFAQTETAMGRDEQFSTKGIRGVQRAPGSESFMGNSREIFVSGWVAQGR